MRHDLWKLPDPSSGRARVEMHQPGGRACSVICFFDPTQNDGYELVFDEVEACKVTFHSACTLEMREAYDQVVELGPTEWLYDILKKLSGEGGDGLGLRHLMIYFDDGPCYEFICRSFRAGRIGGCVQQNLTRQL